MLVSARDSYTANMTLDKDLDVNTEGRQVRVIVEAAVPVGSLAGSYSTSYGTKSQ